MLSRSNGWRKPALGKDEMSDKNKQFIFCPTCGSEKMDETDYEDENGEEDTDGRRCLECGWEGDLSELVCKD
jgi:hypothetical protein